MLVSSASSGTSVDPGSDKAAVPAGKMKFSSFHLFHQHDGWSEKQVYDYNVELVEYLEEQGFHGVWLAEHHFRNYGLCNNVPAMLSHLAGRTSKIRLGSGVIILPLHNPIMIAEELAQLDLLSNGRVDFGVGRGYQSLEFSRFGVELSEARERLEEGLELIHRLWAENEVSFEGKFYRCEGLELKPKPLQRPIPTYVASISPDTVVRCAQRNLPILGDPVATWSSLKRAADTWHRTMDELDFDAGAHELCAMRTVYVGETNEQAREDLARFEIGFDRAKVINSQSAPLDPKTGKIAKGYEFWEGRYLKGGSVDNDFRWDQLEIIGDPERVIQQVRTLQSFGYNNLMCDFGSTRPFPIKEMKRVIKFFADEVMPAFA
ncbi:LLM class flavin-dependent oxidoreductase [Sphingomonas sp. G-3-2-10]|uniref:LLM class flavin-dependent oxidoreductase n=1 Tax=Sphingomonas sp. G-3-2-10 TaxID=2728838 RepID=UPI0019D20CEC|nr:LLM class flavin-dependent oxidoreductase [Sphingomonas sp. G-3-2-10]